MKTTGIQERMRRMEPYTLIFIASRNSNFMMCKLAVNLSAKRFFSDKNRISQRLFNKDYKLLAKQFFSKNEYLADNNYDMDFAFMLENNLSDIGNKENPKIEMLEYGKATVAIGLAILAAVTKDYNYHSDTAATDTIVDIILNRDIWECDNKPEVFYNSLAHILAGVTGADKDKITRVVEYIITNQDELNEKVENIINDFCAGTEPDTEIHAAAAILDLTYDEFLRSTGIIEYDHPSLPFQIIHYDSWISVLENLRHTRNSNNERPDRYYTHIIAESIANTIMAHMDSQEGVHPDSR
jgi:hypothetical protein